MVYLVTEMSSPFKELEASFSSVPSALMPLIPIAPEVISLNSFVHLETDAYSA